LLKIIKHCKESVPDAVTGQLLGLCTEGVLEVTNSFPVPVATEDGDNGQYQVDMMRLLRQVNVDNNTVGWYQSAWLGGFLTQQVLEAQYSYQRTLPGSVVVVYDPYRTTAGRLAIQAYRLSDEFMKLYASKRVSHETFADVNVQATGIFEEVPVKVHNSHLVHAFLYELREQKEMACEHDRLSLQVNPFLEKSLDEMSNLIEAYANEQGKFQFYLRQVTRQKQQLQVALQKLRLENEARIAAGKEPISEDDLLKNPQFKPQPKPPRLESLLLSKQVRYHAHQTNAAAVSGFQKLYVVEALHKPKAEPQA